MGRQDNVSSISPVANSGNPCRGPSFTPAVHICNFVYNWPIKSLLICISASGVPDSRLKAMRGVALEQRDPSRRVDIY